MRLVFPGILMPFMAVSIHASVKDATKALDFDRIYIRVSIHASVKDATQKRAIAAQREEFQSTHL